MRNIGIGFDHEALNELVRNRVGDSPSEWREATKREQSSLADVPEEAAETLMQRGGHGDAIENHEHIAELWSVFLGVEITARQVAEMMVLLKLSRAECGEPLHDHFVDVAGYAAIADFIVREGDDDNT